MFRENVDIAHFGATTSEYDTLWEALVAVGGFELLTDFGEDFIKTGFDDCFDFFAVKGALAVLPYFDGDGFLGIKIAGDEAGLDFLGEVGINGEDNGKVVGDIIGTHWNDSDILEIAFLVNRNTGSGSTKINDGDAVFLLLLV